MEKSLRDRLDKPDSTLNWSLNFQKSLLLSIVTHTPQQRDTAKREDKEE